MKILNLIIVFALLIIASTRVSLVYGQNNIGVSCIGQKFVIPEFDENFRNLVNNQFAVKAGVIDPINLSNATIEIRVYDFNILDGQTVKIIKFYPDSVSASEIGFIDITSREDFIRNRLSYKILYRFPKLRLVGMSSWKSVLDSLISNNLFTMPGQSQLDYEVLKKNPNIKILDSEGGQAETIELKVNDSFRTLYYSGQYSDVPSHIKDFEDVKKVFEILNKIKI